MSSSASSTENASNASIPATNTSIGDSTMGPPTSSSIQATTASLRQVKPQPYYKLFLQTMEKEDFYRLWLEFGELTGKGGKASWDALSAYSNFSMKGSEASYIQAARSDFSKFMTDHYEDNDRETTRTLTSAYSAELSDKSEEGDKGTSGVSPDRSVISVSSSASNTEYRTIEQKIIKKAIKSEGSCEVFVVLELESNFSANIKLLREKFLFTIWFRSTEEIQSFEEIPVSTFSLEYKGETKTDDQIAKSLLHDLQTVREGCFDVVKSDADNLSPHLDETDIMAACLLFHRELILSKGNIVATLLLDPISECIRECRAKREEEIRNRGVPKRKREANMSSSDGSEEGTSKRR
ncbi:hypothetical protein QFC19_009123 [Naganishia cerealis]|uniref:Uncharacterized protein n=1 Tax=Naganishia cerealis TaxID=610337 RepID=A0ACC2UX42_9TREE|nr:hypothetical protein QFC19_009123 [Naganishia cerealis]